MSKIKRTLIATVSFYILLNSLLWGFITVYLNSYNTHNKEHIVMADISMCDDNNMKINVLDKHAIINLSKIKPNKGTVSSLYLVSSEKIKLIFISINSIDKHIFMRAGTNTAY